MYLVLDIETLEKPMPHHILEGAVKAITTKNQEQYKKPETIQSHIDEDIQNFKDKWKFSRQGAQILCIGIGYFDQNRGTSKYACFPSECEREVLVMAFKQLTEMTYGRDFPVYTYNGDSFDWPILIRACAEHEIYPEGKFGRTTDLIKYPFERFLSTISLDSLYDLYKGSHQMPEELTTPGFTNPTGADVAEMWEADKADGGSRIRNYCLQDVEKTGRIARVVRSIFC